MTLQSAISQSPLEKFSTEDEISDEERFSLRLSEGEDEDAGKSENQKSDTPTVPTAIETEEEILNKFEAIDPEPDGVIDEAVLLEEKQQDPLRESEKVDEPSTTNENDDTCEGVEEKKDQGTDTVPEKESGAEGLNGEDNASRVSQLDSVTKELKDTLDTEDLLQVTSVKEADAENDISSGSSSDKEDLEDTADPSIEDTIERDDDNEDDRPSESMDCGDMMDIEENNPLGVEVSEEMDKDYENLLNSEKNNELSEPAQNADIKMEIEKEVEDNSERDKVPKTDDNLIGDGDANGPAKLESDSKVNTSDNSHTIENRNACDDAIKTINEENPATHSESSDHVHEKPEGGDTPKSVKRLLSDCETEIGSKKIRLVESTIQSEQRIVILQTLTDFMRRKSLKKLTRANLEEFCIQKMCEVLVHKNEIGELRHQLQTQEQIMEFWKKESAAMTKQVRDLEIVNKKMLNELKLSKEKETPTVPVKITRSVGLQVKLETMTSKRISRSASEILQTAQSGAKSSPVKSNGGKPATSPLVRHNKETPAPSTTLLSQALTKETALNNNNNSTTVVTNGVANNTATAVTKGVIDLTDEDEKTAITSTTTGSTTVTVPQTPGIRATAGIAIVTTTKPVTSGAAATSTAPKFMYVLQPNPQLAQNGTSDLSKTAGPKAIMFRLQNGVLGSTNGILPNIQNGGSPISSLTTSPTLRTGQVRIQPPVANGLVKNRSVVSHPAPLPPPPTPINTSSRKPIPPKPQLNIRKSGQGIVLSWKLPYSLSNYEVIASYQLYAYQETSSPPNSDMWRKVGDVKALALPMACTLTQFADGNKYYFAVRAVDVLKRIGPFSDPEPISL